MKRIKRERGFYKELTAYLKLTNSKKSKKMWAIEYWLKHKTDSTKDIRFYARFHYHDEIEKSWSLLSLADKEGYEDSTLLRVLDQPRTRMEKAIQRSRLSSIPHVSSIV